jgi:hypothetical protein
MEVGVQICGSDRFTSGESPRLCRESGLRGKEKYLLLPRIELRVSGRPSRILIVMLTEVFHI